MNSASIKSMLPITVLLVSVDVTANDSYREQLSISWHQQNTDSYGGRSLEKDLYILSGTAYFIPVNTRNHALAEAAFLQRTGSIMFTGYQEESVDKVSTINPLLIDEESESRGGEVTVTQMQPDSDFMFGLSYLKSSATDKENVFSALGALYDRDSEIEGYSVTAGYFLDASLQAMLTYGRSEIEYDAQAPVSFRADEIFEHQDLTIKYVGDIGNGQAINITTGISYYAIDDGTDVYKRRKMSLSGDYYLTRAFSVGLEYDRHEFNQSDDNIDTTGIRSTFFVQPDYAISVSYGESKYDVSTLDEIHYSVELLARF